VVRGDIMKPADVVYHYSVTRPMSAREFASLQSFPNRFIFTIDLLPGMIDGRHGAGSSRINVRRQRPPR